MKFEMTLCEAYFNEWHEVCDYCLKDVSPHYALHYESSLRNDVDVPLSDLELKLCEEHVQVVEPRIIIGLGLMLDYEDEDA